MGSKNKKSESLIRRSDLWPSIDSFFTDPWGNWPKLRMKDLDSFVPAVNIKEDDKAYYVEAELPGVKKEDMEISVKDGSLTLKGEKKTFKEDKKENFHRVERSYGSFYRMIPLANDCDTEQVSANYQDGLLTVTVGKKKTKESNGRKISIK
jgi:HSP20 family protein